MHIDRIALSFCCVLGVVSCASAELIRVGPNREVRLPSEAAKIAGDGDVIEIDAGDYKGDVAVWRQNGLTLRGVGGRVHLNAAGEAAEGKAIWVIKGDQTTVERIEFSGASVGDHNGAGIRHEGRDLTVRHCVFRDNENGILGGGGNVLVEYSEFAHNGFGDGQSHNMYISGRTQRFTLRFSYTHHAHIGHNVKSRAAENWILYNRIMDEADGDSSYLVDLPNGGIAYVIGNVMHQGTHTDNHVVLAYAAEGVTRKENSLFVINNSVVNDNPTGVFVRNRAQGVNADLINNLLVGRIDLSQGRVTSQANMVTQQPYFVDQAHYDYRLTRRSPAIGRGVDPGRGNGEELRPKFEYVQPLGRRSRPVEGNIDVGAYEFEKNE